MDYMIKMFYNNLLKIYLRHQILVNHYQMKNHIKIIVIQNAEQLNSKML